MASSIGQIGDVLRDRETGLLVPPGDLDALVAAIRELADDERLRSGLGARARAVAAREHDWSDRIRRVLDVARDAGAGGEPLQAYDAAAGDPR